MADAVREGARAGAEAGPPGGWAEDLARARAILAGDEAALADLVQRHHASLVRLATGYVPRSLAEEVAQETWLAVIEGLAAFQGRSSLRTWVFRILLNRARTRGAREARAIAVGGAEATLQAAAPAVDPARFDGRGRWSAPPRRWDDDTPEKLALDREARAVIEQAIAALPAGQREVLVLRDVEGLDADEVCALLELSEVNQRVRLHRARAAVRAALERYLEGA